MTYSPLLTLNEKLRNFPTPSRLRYGVVFKAYALERMGFLRFLWYVRNLVWSNFFNASSGESG